MRGFKKLSFVHVFFPIYVRCNKKCVFYVPTPPDFSQYIAPNPQIYYYYSKKTLQPHFILHFHTRFLMFIRDNTIEWTAFDNIYMK